MAMEDEGVRAGVLCDALLHELLRSSSASGGASGGSASGSSGEISARTPREIDVHAPSLAPVIALAHCACVSKAWRGAVLRRLVRVLSPPFDPWSRAGAAAAIQAYSSQGEALALVENNGIAPLLALAQAAPRRQDLTPEPSAHPAALTMADNACVALGMLACVAGEQLTAAGWTLMDPTEAAKERGAGAVQAADQLVGATVYEHNETGQLTGQNPLLGSGNDAADLLQEVPSLLSPQWMPKEKRVRWPALIRHHRTAGGFSPPVDEDLTVLDEYICAPPGEESGPESEELRQLVLGAWAGLTGFRETEWNLAEAPGENLYAWYTTALAAVVALRVGSQRQQRRPRLLLIGLGGGSLATFFGHHYGSSVEIDVVERSAPVVHAAETYFGLRDHEAAADDADSGEAGDAVPSGELPNGTRVQVHGLVNAVAHNGKVGSVAAWVPARGRFEVSLDKGKTIFVKMANLRQLGAVSAKDKQKETEGDAWGVFGSESDSSDDDDDGGDEGGGKAEDDAWGVFGSDSDDDDADGDADEADEVDAEEDTEQEEVPRMTVHVEDALRFARRAAAAVAGAVEAGGEEPRWYDAILLDVYTQENFPQELLSAEFFADLRCLLRRGGGEGGQDETPAGCIAVNVGGAGAEGGGFDTVLQRLCELSLDGGSSPALRRVDVLLEDDTEPSQNDEDADPEEDLGTANAVLVGWGGGAMPPALSVEEWAEADAVGRAASAKTSGHPLPFRLGTCISEMFVPPTTPAPLRSKPMEMSAEQLRTLRGLLREGVDDAAAAFLAGAEAAQNPAVRLSGTQLAELQGLLQPGRDDAAASFLEDAQAAEQAARRQQARREQLQAAAAAAAPAAAAAAEVAAAAEAQTVVVHRLSFQEAENTDGAAAQDSADAHGATMAVSDAQKTSVLHIPKFLSAEEVASIHDVAEAFIAQKAVQNAAPQASPEGAPAEAGAPARSSPAWETGRKWNVSFLHSGGLFQAKLPAIRRKILELGRRSDREHWGQMAAAGLPEEKLGIRFVEYHRMVEGAGLANPRHYDSGSTVTIDIMLSDSAAGDFEGGRFQTLEADGELLPHRFEIGDALVFVSHKYHCVAPLTAGRRRVLVTELYTGEHAEFSPSVVQWTDASTGEERTVRVADEDSLAQTASPSTADEPHLAADLGGWTGGAVWEGAQLLSRLLIAQPASLWQQRKRVLELGAGVGLVGLVAAELGAREVTLTDQVVFVAQHNLANAGLSAAARERVSVRRLKWGEAEDLASAQGPYDLLLGSDIMYDPNLYDALAETIIALTAADGEVLLVTREGSPTDAAATLEAAFYGRLRGAGFEVADITKTEEVAETLRLVQGRYTAEQSGRGDLCVVRMKRTGAVLTSLES